MAAVLWEKADVGITVTTVARMLRSLRARWDIVRPVVLFPCLKVRKSPRVREILTPSRSEVAFFEDEVDKHLIPRIGRSWALRDRRKIVVTPG